jgi:hypothetical protein
MDTDPLIAPGRGSGGEATLNDWVAQHGPLSSAVALLIALRACGRASRLTYSELAASVRSLDTSHIRRAKSEDWTWVPSRAARTSQTASDRDVIERLGALLFHCLAAASVPYPLPAEHELRTRIRTVRPDLPPPIVDLTVHAVLIREGSNDTLAEFARRVRYALGAERHSGGRVTPHVMTAAAACMAAVVTVSWLGLSRAPGADRLETHGLTSHETAVLDVAQEMAQTYAFMDEHTAAYDAYSQIARIWAARVSSPDPRIAWNEAGDAWVRALAGDRFTTEQELEGALSVLSTQLGDRHPYTRTVKLDLAATLVARRATAEAAAFRHEAEWSAGELLHGAGLTTSTLQELPVGPGVLAHVAPTPPEREGFRRGANGRFFAPLTTIQRWIADQKGWRLHLVVDGPCDTSLPAGPGPGLVTVRVVRVGAWIWRVQITGVDTPVALEAPGSERVGISLVTKDNRGLLINVGEAPPLQRVLTASGPTAEPPYMLTFRNGPGGTGCRVVWLEIAFPFQPQS